MVWCIYCINCTVNRRNLICICWINTFFKPLVDSFSYWLSGAQGLQNEKTRDPGQWAHFVFSRQFYSMLCGDNTLQNLQQHLECPPDISIVPQLLGHWKKHPPPLHFLVPPKDPGGEPVYLVSCYQSSENSYNRTAGFTRFNRDITSTPLAWLCACDRKK